MQAGNRGAWEQVGAMYHPTVTAARPAVDPGVLDTAALLLRLLNLVGLALPHLRSHPEAYANGTGELLRRQILTEAFLIFRGRAPTDDELANLDAAHAFP